MTKHLQKAAVTLIGDQACKKFYPVQISSRMVCAGFPQGAVDSCSVSATAANAAAGRSRSLRRAWPCLPQPSRLSVHLHRLWPLPRPIPQSPRSAGPTTPTAREPRRAGERSGSTEPIS